MVAGCKAMSGGLSSDVVLSGTLKPIIGVLSAYPDAEALTVYKPGGRKANTYQPSTSVKVARWLPLSSLINFTVTFDKGLPEGPNTRPTIVPDVVCALETGTATKPASRQIIMIKVIGLNGDLKSIFHIDNPPSFHLMVS
jgi:hypothetical protein